MQPELPSYFLLYATLFRLGIVMAGCLSIVFGYRLLSLEARRTQGKGSVEASLGRARLLVKGQAPGTILATFGMILIAVMVYQGMPELRYREGSADGVVLRGDPVKTADLATLTERGIQLHESDPHAAAASYEQALELLATPANNLASLYLQLGRSVDAVALARLAVTLRPTQASLLDTLSSALASTGNYAEAISAAQRAAEIDTKYQQKLETLRAKVRQ